MIEEQIHIRLGARVVASGLSEEIEMLHAEPLQFGFMRSEE